MSSTLKPLPEGRDSDAAALDTGVAPTQAEFEFDDEIDLEHIPERLPAGTYEFEIVETMPTRSKKSDQPMIICNYAVISGEYAGQRVSEYLSFSPGAMGFTVEKLGIIFGGKLPNIGSTGKLAAALLHRTFRARTLVDDYEGSKRPKIERYIGRATGDDSAAASNGAGGLNF